MKNRLNRLAIITITVFLVLQTFFQVFAYFTRDEANVVYITLPRIFVGLVSIFIIGIACGQVWKHFKIKTSDEDLKIAGGGVFGLSFFGSLCLGGGCIPGALLGSIMTIPAMLFLFLGSKITSDPGDISKLF